MRGILLAAILTSLSLPIQAAEDTWSHVWLVDHKCLSEARKDPDKHKTSCLIMCAESGYGMLRLDGIWVKFDGPGNKKALAALRATAKKDHIRVKVTGVEKGDTIYVSSVTVE